MLYTGGSLMLSGINSMITTVMHVACETNGLSVHFEIAFFKGLHL